MEQQFDFAGEKFTDKSYNKPNLGQGVWSQLKWVFIPACNGDKRAYESWRKEAFMVFVDQASVTPEHKLLNLRQHFSGEDIRLWLATQQWLAWNGNSIEIGDEYHCISKN